MKRHGLTIETRGVKCNAVANGCLRPVVYTGLIEKAAFARLVLSKAWYFCNASIFL
jgi:hypothetical protein